MNNFLEYIKAGKYENAKDIVKDMSSDEFYNFIVELGFDTNILALYTFVIFLLIEKESAELQYCAASLIAQVFCYVDSAYSMGLFHARRAVALAPNDPSYKEYLLSYYYIPDKLLTFEEALVIAKELELQAPGNIAAKHFFQDIKSKNPEYLKK